MVYNRADDQNLILCLTPRRMIYMAKKLGNSNQEELQFMTITSDEKESVVRCYIRGEFVPPEFCAAELSLLDSLADNMNTVEFFINSPGGSADTLVELISIKEKFKYSIGIVTGDASSAGFLLWASCDLRVVHPYASLMIHRESFVMAGKTKHHLDHIKHTNEVFTKITRELLTGIITEKEFEEIQHSEVYFSADTMIEREAAIAYSYYLQNRDNPYKVIELVSYSDDLLYMRSGDSLIPVTSFDVDTESAINELFVKFALIDYIDDPSECDTCDGECEQCPESEDPLIDDYKAFEASMADKDS